MTPRSELVWRGKIHLGDGPGTFSDAVYGGLRTELPLTLLPFPADATHPGKRSNRVTFTIRSEEVTPVRGQLGHPVAVIEYVQLTHGEAWTERVLVTDILTSNVTNIDVEIAVAEDQLPRVRFLGIRVGINTAVAPGLYDDFILTSVTLEGTQYYASLGYTR